MSGKRVLRAPRPPRRRPPQPRVGARPGRKARDKKIKATARFSADVLALLRPTGASLGRLCRGQVASQPSRGATSTFCRIEPSVQPPNHGFACGDGGGGGRTTTASRRGRTTKRKTHRPPAPNLGGRSAVTIGGVGRGGGRVHDVEGKRAPTPPDGKKHRRSLHQLDGQRPSNGSSRRKQRGQQRQEWRLQECWRRHEPQGE